MNDLRSDDDGTNSDDVWSAEDYFLLPSDAQEEVGKWDVLDVRGSDFEQRVSCKEAARKLASQRGKDKKALKNNASLKFRKKMQRVLRDQDVFHRY